MRVFAAKSPALKARKRVFAWLIILACVEYAKDLYHTRGAQESVKGKRVRIPHGPATVIGEPPARNHWQHDAGKDAGSA